MKKKKLKLLNKIERHSRGTITLDPDYVYKWEIYTGKKLNYEKTLFNYKKKIERLLLNYIVICRFENQKNIYDLYVNIIIRLVYLLGWSYIFYLSDPLTFRAIIYFFFKIYLYMEEPFSGLFL